MTSYNNLLLQVTDQTAVLTVNREQKLNALNRETVLELTAAFRFLEQQSEVRGVILTGAGEKAFVAGADITEFASLDDAGAETLAKEGHGLMDTIYNFSKPVIAAINGFALGGGLELALSCHIRVASTNAQLGLPEVSLGIIPGYGGTQRLTQLIGRGKALEMIMTADRVGANEAYNWGLVNHVVDPAAIMDFSKQLLQKIFARSPNAISKAIDAVNTAIQTPQKGFEKEIELFGQCFASPEAKEGIAAFIEKRKPNF
ncbi:enoyl-CoA hydratase [Sphingobacterium alkalisoli]|uniref:Enoyl-CoA hydratase n=1 Tax=Sphingobacterium alkalisoli TaxID=1874115 RepID=A0A4V5LX64_9SPHI|nr:enoyl-CoA hydratase-related protein [Sphingobacterium alkalisoli]TJY61329.1 enoyl-CoA hydratase [Sphingobacterium alkalisoli]GGH30931.1 enoyl-CoA hydratase [Sphingobacterium alkalisoli]